MIDKVILMLPHIFAAYKFFLVTKISSDVAFINDRGLPLAFSFYLEPFFFYSNSKLAIQNSELPFSFEP